MPKHLLIQRWLLVLACVGCALKVNAHDIPNKIDLQAFVKAERDTVEMTVRIPLVMLLNLNLPKDGRGFLALDLLEPGLRKAADATASEIELSLAGQPLTYRVAQTRISLPSDESFGSHAEAKARIQGDALPASKKVFWNQGYFDAYYEYSAPPDANDLAVRLQIAPGMKNIVRMHLRFINAEGAVRAYEIGYDDGRVNLDPGWMRAAATFVRLGAAHILDGPDHLLFLLCLVVPFSLGRVWPLVGVVSAFTVGHTVTLVIAATGVLNAGPWFSPVVELLIALSIIYMAVENVVAADLRRRWLIAGLFGLIHGFGFASALQQQLQFAGTHLITSLLAFNVGVELGQLLVMLPTPILVGLVLRGPKATRYGLILLSLIAGHTGWHWMLERWRAVRRVEWPSWAETPMNTAMPLLILLVVSAATLVVHRVVARRTLNRSVERFVLMRSDWDCSMEAAIYYL